MYAWSSTYPQANEKNKVNKMDNHLMINMEFWEDFGRFLCKRPEVDGYVKIGADTKSPNYMGLDSTDGSVDFGSSRYNKLGET